MLAGWNYHPSMFPLQPYVNVPATTCFDPVHVYLLGIVPEELGACMKNLRGDFSYEEMGEYVQLWRWPQTAAAPPRKLFTPEAAKNHKAKEHFSCGASELLSLLLKQVSR